jgi:hypothetical protein
MRRMKCMAANRRAEQGPTRPPCDSASTSLAPCVDACTDHSKAVHAMPSHLQLPYKHEGPPTTWRGRPHKAAAQAGAPPANSTLTLTWPRRRRPR